MNIRISREFKIVLKWRIYLMDKLHGFVENLPKKSFISEIDLNNALFTFMIARKY